MRRGGNALLAALAIMGSLAGTRDDTVVATQPAPRDPPNPKDPKATTVQHRTAADLEVELPRMVEVLVPPTMLRTDHVAAAIIKAQKPHLNRKQRRVLLARMQKRETNSRLGVYPR